MDSRRVERVEGWDSRPFSGGFEELRGLADGEFSGAVTAGSTWLFMLNGRVIGVFDGGIDDFDGTSGTRYDAPHPSVPLLFAMQETGGEERANYYTNDTPISEADSTLSSGGFTGYVELSENVLSGDYYVVYYAGRSMSCAFIGTQERLLTGDEAFDRADDEVGIYTVMDVDLEVTDIPAPEPPTEPDTGTAMADGAVGGVAGGGGDSSVAGSEDDTADEAERTDRAAADPVPDEEPAQSRAGSSEHEGVETGGTAEASEGHDQVDDRSPEGRGVDRPAADSGSRPVERSASERSASERSVSERSASERSASDRPADAETARTGATESDRTEAGRMDDAGPTGSSTDAGSTEVDDDAVETPVQIPDDVMEAVESEASAGEDPVFEEEAEWRETRSIPSINPDHSETADTTEEPTDEGQPGRSRRESRTDPTASAGGSSSGSRGNAGADPTSSASEPRGNDSDRSRTSESTGGSDEPLEEEMLQREDKIDRLQQRLSNVEEERTELRAERDQLADENAELKDEVAALEAELDELEAELAELTAELEAQLGPAAGAGTELSPRNALEGTNLFVRYGSKGKPTLDTARDDGADADAVNANLRLEHHTGFDAEDVAVDGRSYVEFLHDSIEFRFVEWFVRDLLYEIRDTGNEAEMRGLYDAIPEVDRAELYGSVSLQYDENGEEHREQTTFDVVVRDRMGNPLVVANLNDSRDPTTEEMMVDVQERASRVKRTSDSLAGAVVVTASFFDPGALETAAEATSGSFLSRDSKKSFVKLSRKVGYHLCLVESRNGEFHINVPEL